ncbi:MAG: hypothetical protein KKA19_04840 [Candidatus Margulisbacteria bacterium]|nr:hypothetical protein [Candidatus Margulisiibacteriota bacterium]
MKKYTLIASLLVVIFIIGCGNLSKETIESDAGAGLGLTASDTDLVQVAQVLAGSITTKGGEATNTGEVLASWHIATGNTLHGDYIKTEYFSNSESSKPGWFESRSKINGYLKYVWFEKGFRLDDAGNIVEEYSTPYGPYNDLLNYSFMTDGKYRYQYQEEVYNTNGDVIYTLKGYRDAFIEINQSQEIPLAVTESGNPQTCYFNNFYSRYKGNQYYEEISDDIGLKYDGYLSVYDVEFFSDNPSFDSATGQIVHSGRIFWDEVISTNYQVLNEYYGNVQVTVNWTYNGTVSRTIVYDSFRGKYVPNPFAYTVISESTSGNNFSTKVYRIDNNAYAGTITFDTNSWKIYVYNATGKLISTLNWSLF